MSPIGKAPRSCNMIDAIKKTLLTGLGATVVTVERVEKSLEELINRGKISANEAKDVANKIVADGKKEWEESRENLSASFETMLKKANLVTQSELAALEKRVAELEGESTPEEDETTPEEEL